MFSRSKLIGLTVIAGTFFLPSLLLAQSNSQSEEGQRDSQNMVTIWIVSSRYSPGGPVQIADYGESEDLAEQTAKSQREARGNDNQQLYFDVQVIKKEVPASSSPSTRRKPQGPVDAPNSGSQGGKPGGGAASGSSTDSATSKRGSSSTKDKQWVLWTQKKVDGR